MDRSNLLRTTYRINSAATLACGIALLAAGHELAPLFALPAAALWATGAVFVALAARIWIFSRRAQLVRGEALLVGLLDGVYALASFAALAAFEAQMTTALRVAVALIAAPVALFAAVELSCALRLRASPAVE